MEYGVERAEQPGWRLDSQQLNDVLIRAFTLGGSRCVLCTYSAMSYGLQSVSSLVSPICKSISFLYTGTFPGLWEL